jgi:hypothetical protein
MGASREKVTQRLDWVISNLPPKKLEQLLEFAEYLKSREDWAATRELMKDPNMVRDVEEGRAQAARGKGKTWRDVRKRIRG